LADRRVDAVAGDRDAAAHGRARRPVRAVGECHGNAGIILLDAEAVMICDDPVVPGAGAESIEQHHLQIAAMNGELRMIVTGGASQRLLIDQLAEPIEEGRVPGLDREARQRAFEAERRKLLGGVRQQIDADPDGLDLGCRLEDPAGNVRRVQREPQRQPADAAADDNDVVHVSVPRAFADDETRLVSSLSIWPLYPYHLAPLLSAEARLRAKADAGRGRSRRLRVTGRLRALLLFRICGSGPSPRPLPA